MKGFEVIAQNARFAYLYKNSKKDFSKGFVLFYKSELSKEVGFTASKKIGNAVKRNFAKRRLRAIFLEVSPYLQNGSYILVARQNILMLDFRSLKEGFIKSLKKVKALEKEVRI